METKDQQVHASHCCIHHGCKYADADCPVVKGTIAQKYRCEECQDYDPDLTVEEIQAELWRWLGDLEIAQSQIDMWTRTLLEKIKKERTEDK